MAKAQQKQQGELFQAETTWFHVFKDMIDSGDMAKLQGSSMKVYLVIKAHTNFSTGRAFPAIETISDKSGLSDPQVKRCLKELQDYGYITKEKRGRNNIYTLREKVNINDIKGRPVAAATWDYIPHGVRESVADLKNVLLTGDLSGAKIVHIENLNIQINNNESLGVQVNAADMEALRKFSPSLADKLEKSMKNKN
jgi:DNA-binding Lrp family transcriptional regulator